MQSRRRADAEQTRSRRRADAEQTDVRFSGASSCHFWVLLCFLLLTDPSRAPGMHFEALLWRAFLPEKIVPNRDNFVFLRISVLQFCWMDSCVFCVFPLKKSTKKMFRRLSLSFSEFTTRAESSVSKKDQLLPPPPYRILAIPPAGIFKRIFRYLNNSIF